MASRKNLQKEMLKYLLRDLNEAHSSKLKMELKNMGYSDLLSVDSISMILNQKRWAKKLKSDIKNSCKFKYIGDDIKTHKDKKTLRKMYNQRDMKIINIADELDVNRKTVTRWLKKYGLKGGA